MDEMMKKLVDAPLADALKLHLPAGKRAGPKNRKPQADKTFAPPITHKQVRERKEAAMSAKTIAVLDYYATTTVPVDRVASHCGISVEDATKAMLRRGRVL